MNFEQAKALRIQQWRDTLDNHDFRMQNPEAHRSCLIANSARLAEERLIDLAEQFDMDEMANAAYWHAVEELQSTTVLYHSASRYELVSRDGLPSLGTIHQSTFTDRTESQRIHAYDGQVYRQGGKLVLICRGAPNGVIEGLVLTLDDGRQFDLVETARMIKGVVYAPIEDPDFYQSLVEISQVALEQKNLVLMEKTRPFLELARFVQCPSCINCFGRREDCPTCDGCGFISK
ncbi:hypothetical protein [Pseudomonas alvandae]|uniref:hypothetical protein n=1 Tax=Pseudomonas canavaninivorans TaxID=2842348 RepID=UPI00215F9BE9|nr:hypothetical protein [Pseudomonas canavaninivorans]UVM74942.1 hypothetical protein LOY40_12565 [Pseudomonas canavaninivorans]